MKAEVFFDGGARPTNPGHAGCGVVVKVAGQKIRVGRYLGIKTNNEAEFIGLIVGLKIALDKGADQVVITGDSLNVLNTVKGDWQCRKDTLKPLHREAQQLVAKFENGAKFVHVRGHQGHVENEECDKLATNAAKHGMVHRRNSNPFTVRALGRVPDEGEIVDVFAPPMPGPSSFLRNHLRARGQAQ